MARTYFVYVLASDSRELYIGVTGNLERRVSQHRAALKRDGYTAKHQTTRLVYCETTDNVLAAITREKHIKVMSFGPFASLRVTNHMPSCSIS